MTTWCYRSSIVVLVVLLFFLLHLALAAAQCKNWICLWDVGCVCLWVCYHDNSKLCASILTKLGLNVKVVTVTSWLNLAVPWPREGGLQWGEIFWLLLTTASAQSLHLLWVFFSLLLLLLLL